MACSPLQGSEPGVGWRWAVEIAKLGHDVTVLTHPVFKSEIERGLVTIIAAGTIRFEYLDPFPTVKFGGSSPSILVYIYIYAWQFAAYWHARKISKPKFDIVHHITFGGIRFPSFLGAHGRYFIIGPLGGGEATPPALRSILRGRARLEDTFRTLWNALLPLDPMMRHTFCTADKVLLKSPDNLFVVPKRLHGNVEYALEIGIDVDGEGGRSLRRQEATATLRLLYVGRLLGWKGLALGLRALAIARKAGVDVTLTIVGAGPEEGRWRALADELGISDIVIWKGWVAKESLSAVYLAHDVFLFPSLHDSSGNVVLEATSNGLPVICLNTGGPGHMLPEYAGMKVDVHNKTLDEVVTDISRAILELAADRNLVSAMGSDAHRWASSQTWVRRVSAIYEKLTP